MSRFSEGERGDTKMANLDVIVENETGEHLEASPQKTLHKPLVFPDLEDSRDGLLSSQLQRTIDHREQYNNTTAT